MPLNKAIKEPKEIFFLKKWVGITGSEKNVIRDYKFLGRRGIDLSIVGTSQLAQKKIR